MAALAARPYIGLMSGTSLDGIDGVMVEFGDTARRSDDPPLPMRVLAHSHFPFDREFAAELLALNSPGGDEIHRGCLAANAIARSGAEVVERLLAAAGRLHRDIAAIGSHGQTVRHRPLEFDGTGYTVQLNNPALLAELTEIDVIADFRSRDIAAGGQGAPLVPAFHRAAFATPGRPIAVLNLGGIANLTVLDADGSASGFDCGPANALLDDWCQRHRGERYDESGNWARSGRVDRTLLAALRSDAYFSLEPPKSTGRDHFDRNWIDARLGATERGSLRAEDVQATLAELTASTCADDIERYAPHAERILVCGGGALNGFLLERIGRLLPGRSVLSTDAAGLPAQQVEAAAFAWLARAWQQRLPANMPSATGAAGPRVLGALYPGR